MSEATAINRPVKTRGGAFLTVAVAASLTLSAGCQLYDPRPAPLATPTVIWKSSLSEDTSSAATDAKIVQTSASAAVKRGTAAHALPVDSETVQTETECTIDLATAFQLAGVDNPTINLSREAVREAVARQLAAQVLLLPNLTVGGNYHYHNGPLQTSSGIIRRLDEQSLYFGLGARALAAESVAFPGVRLFGHLGDAMFEPLATRQNLEARRSTAVATEHNTLLDVAEAYFELLGAEVRLEALRLGEAELAEIVRLTTSYAKNGQGRAGDKHRAESRARLVHRQAQETEGAVAVASARLAGLLNLDSSVRLRTPGGAIQPLQLIDENEDLTTLIHGGLINRPEARARIQELAEARTRIRQERVRPFVPTLSVGFSAGGFGGGSNLTANGITQPGGGIRMSSSFGNFDGRMDFDVFAVWTLQNAGVGNRAWAHRAEAVAGEATAELERTNNEIRAQIGEAQAAAQAAARQIEMARTQLDLAREGFREEMTRIKQTVGRPLETLDSFRQLLDARQDILRSVVAYNSAQYRLFVAVGASPLQSLDSQAPLPCKSP